MKKSLIVVGLISAFIFSGCSNSSSSAKNGEEVQKLIDKTGWTIERPTGGRLIESVDFIIDKHTEISVEHDVPANTISGIYFTENKDEYYVVINEKGKNTGLHKISIESTKTDCDKYNIDENKESTDVEDSSHYDVKCDVKDSEKLQELKKLRDKYLSDAGITMDDLYTWGKWYFENNK